MRRTSVVLLYFMININSLAQIVLSEIMFNPAGNERYDEFIELYNLSTNDSVDMFGWRLSDGTKFNTILPYEETSILLPGHYALLLVPNYFKESRLYENEIPENVLILTIDASQFGAYGLKNSAGERVSIYQPDARLVASYEYTSENSDGFSEEKIDLEKDDAVENWNNSTKQGGTPGYKNSVARQQFDLGLAPIDIFPEHPSTKDSLHVWLTIVNLGEQPVDACTINLYDSTETDSHLVLLAEKNMAPYGLSPQDSIKVDFVLAPLTARCHFITAEIFFAADGQPFNNSRRLACQISTTYAAGAVVFNEIMYDTDEKTDEWLELFNTSPSNIDLANWSLKDKRKTVILTEKSWHLKPGGYCLVTNRAIDGCDSSVQLINAGLPEFNNTGDELVLMDAVCAIIDSVSYQRSFGGGRNISLERFRAEDNSTMAINWNSCKAKNGCTPGQFNSISPKEYDASIRGVLQLTPAKPMDGDDVFLSLVIANAGQSAIHDIRIVLSAHSTCDPILFTIGETVVEAMAENNVAVVRIPWPAIPPGVHIVYAEISAPMDMDAENNILSDTITVSYLPGSLVINEIMYSPSEDESEWVELFNKSDKAIELMNWCISDSDTSKLFQLTKSSTIIQPEEFMMISHDSSFKEKGNFFSLVCPQLSSFNNDVDRVVIYDGNKRIVDSVSYTSEWGGARGRSLERINPRVSSSEATNWTTCVEASGHTAGHPNSVFIEVLPSATSLAVSPDPFSPDGDGRDDFVGISYSLPGAVAQVNIKIFDIKGRLVRFLLNNNPSGAERTIYWDGLSDEGRTCRIGIYIIYLEALNETKMCIEQAKTMVVLAGVL